AGGRQPPIGRRRQADNLRRPDTPSGALRASLIRRAGAGVPTRQRPVPRYFSIWSGRLVSRTTYALQIGRAPPLAGATGGAAAPRDRATGSRARRKRHFTRTPLRPR